MRWLVGPSLLALLSWALVGTNPVVYENDGEAFGTFYPDPGSSSENESFLVYDCSGISSKSKVAVYSLNKPASCKNTSSKYERPKKKKIQVVQITNVKPLEVVNCYVSLEIFVGYCGTSTLANFMHHMKKTYTDILYPMGAECFHSLETNRLTFKIPPYNSVGEMIVEINLAAGVGTKELYVVGRVSLDSDCQGGSYTPVNGNTIYRAVVLYRLSTKVKKVTGIYNMNKKRVTIPQLITFEREEVNTGGHSIVGDVRLKEHVINEYFNHFETYKDLSLGTFAYDTRDIPQSDCEKVITLGTSNEALLYNSRSEAPDIIMFRKNDTNTHVGLTLHEKIAVCGHEGYRTSVKDVMVILLNPKDLFINTSSALPDLDNEIVLESAFVSIAVKAELSSDQNFMQLEEELCHIQRASMDSKLQLLKQPKAQIFNSNGQPLHVVATGETLVVFSCNEVSAKLRHSSKLCCEELPILLKDKEGNYKVEAYSEATTRRVKMSCTETVCAGPIRPGFNIGSSMRPTWVYINADGSIMKGLTPETFHPRTLFRSNYIDVNEEGLFSMEDRKHMQEISELRDARKAVAAHLQMRIVRHDTVMEALGFEGEHKLNTDLGQHIKTALLPFPFNLWVYVPAILRIIMSILIFGLMVRLCVQPIVNCRNRFRQGNLTAGSIFRWLIFGMHDFQSVQSQELEMEELNMSLSERMNKVEFKVEQLSKLILNKNNVTV